MSTSASSWAMKARISVMRSRVRSDNASIFHVKSTRLDGVSSACAGAGSAFPFALTGSHRCEFGSNWCQDWNFGSAGTSVGSGVSCFQDMMFDWMSA